MSLVYAQAQEDRFVLEELASVVALPRKDKRGVLSGYVSAKERLGRQTQ